MAFVRLLLVVLVSVFAASGHAWAQSGAEDSSALRAEVHALRSLNRTLGEIKQHWMNLKLTRGVKSPKVLRSAKLVKRYLKRVRGGIGYIYAHEVDESVKIVKIEGLSNAKQLQ